MILISKRALVTALLLSASTTASAGVPAAAAIDAKGGVHMIRATGVGLTAEYAYCAGGCARTGELKVAFELEAPARGFSVALGADGRPQLLIETRNRVHYAACTGDCTRPDGWVRLIAVEHSGRFGLDGAGLAVAADGAASFRIVPRAEEDVPAGRAFVASCAGDCTEPARWTAHLDLSAASAPPAVAAR
ncbi:MAG: hypothetical protein QM704_27625 [Anaeromyxobacteraceae bacterium]